MVTVQDYLKKKNPDLTAQKQVSSISEQDKMQQPVQQTAQNQTQQPRISNIPENGVTSRSLTSNKSIKIDAPTTFDPKTGLAYDENGKQYGYYGNDEGTPGTTGIQNKDTLEPVTPVANKLRTVATKQQPVIDRTPQETPTGYQAPDYSMIQGMDQDGLQGFIDTMNLKVMKGEQLTDQEILNLTKAQRQLMADQSKVINPYDDTIARAESQREKELARIQRQANERYNAEERAIRERYNVLQQEQQRLGEKTMDTVQGALSFSGFGRSTYAAEKQAEVQSAVNANISALSAQREAEIAKAEAERQNAPAEVIASYDNYISQLEAERQVYQNELIQSMNEYNQQNTLNYQEKIDNILQLAYQFKDLQEPLTEEEMAIANSYATLAIDKDGNINQKFLEGVPAKMLGAVLLEASRLKSETVPGTEYGFSNVGGGVVAVTDPVTGEVRFEQGPVAGEYKTVEIGGDPYSFDTTTGIATPIGGVTGDLRGLASQFPGQAWAKNNNPAGITWNANFDNPQPGTTAYALQQAGIEYSKGTPRTASDGGNYVTFNTIEDGLLAQRIIMTQTYGDSTVGQMLNSWVGTAEGPAYARQVAGNAGVDINTRVSDLSDEQLASLQIAKINKESPGLGKLLANQNEKSVTEGKETWLNLLRTGNVTNTKREELASQAIKEGWTDEFEEALKQGAKTNLTDRQYAVYDKEKSKFMGNQQIKQFEEAMNQYSAVKGALERADGVGDMAGIFAFMKTLDPSSVVRESEFEAAANSTGVIAKWGNIFNRLQKGKKLTQDQAKSFVEMANKFIESRATTYDRLYDDMNRVLDQYGIPTEFKPTRATEQLSAMAKPQTTETINISDDMQSLWDSL